MSHAAKSGRNFIPARAIYAYISLLLGEAHLAGMSGSVENSHYLDLMPGSFIYFLKALEGQYKFF